MLNIYLNFLKYKFLANKLLIFFAGLFLGIALSITAIYVPWDRDSSKQDSQFSEEQSDFNPFQDFELPTNERIDAKIRYYLRSGRKADLIRKYQRSGKYMPMIRAIFEEYNLPPVLVFLPILESGFLPKARSKVGATGLWQLMPATASEHGLKYNQWIDERRDPEKSTVAAAELLSFLYKKFGDWDLVLAAYNCGYGKLRRVMRSDKTINYWELKRLPRETYHFVPNFYAILSILANPGKYGVRLPNVARPMDYETIDLEATFSIEQIAKLAKVSPAELKRYNPALINNIAPSGKYTIKVPHGVKEQFHKAYKDNPPEHVEFTYTTYRVRKGDSLYEIAKKFGTTVKALMADNNLRSSRLIKVGQRLRVASVSVVDASNSIETPDVTSNKSENTGKIKFVHVVVRDSIAINTLARYWAVTAEELKVYNPWIQKEWLHRGVQVEVYKLPAQVSMHKARRGDSLWKLSRRYDTSVANIKRWNQLYGSRIYPGQRLVVKLI